jgi:hypothetical protein
MDSISSNYELDPSYPDPAAVEAEYRRATLMPASRDWLRDQGVPDDAMDGVTECTSGYVRDDGGAWHFKIGIEPELNRTLAVENAFHLPVMIGGRFVDLIRFTRQSPNHVRHGGRICHAATWLGNPVREALDSGGWPVPTPIWRWPISWLRAGRKGLCYLRQSWPTERLDLLRSLPAVMAEHIQHALDLDKATWQSLEQRRKRPHHWARIPDNAELVTHATRAVMKEIRS